MIPARRLEMNRGYGESPGVWRFDDLLFEDSLIGAATVKYTFHVSKNTERGAFDPTLDTAISGATVQNIVVFDDAGEEIPVTGDAFKEMSEVVLEIFSGIENEVREYEMCRLT